MKKKVSDSVVMYVSVNGKKYKMVSTANGNLIARGVEFQSGENKFMFGDSRMTIASRMIHNSNKKMCLIHTFPLNCFGTRDVMSVCCKNPKVYDVMLIAGKKRKDARWSVQIRFSTAE